MSDLDPAYDIGPTPSDFIHNNRRRVMGEAMTSLADDPEKAGRAYELGRATGDSPALIYSNLDNYEEQHKAALTSQLLSSNDHLREYLEADAMHAKVSNDDYANLDTVSGKLANFRKLTHESVAGLPTRTAESAWMAAWKGFHEGIGEGPLGGWTQTVPQLAGDKLAQSLWATAAMPLEVPFRLLAGGIRGATEATLAGVESATGSPQLARDLAGMAEMQLTGTGVHGVHIDPAMIKKAHDALESTKLWLDNGREPPPGLSPMIDKLKKEQNDTDLKRLDEMLSDAQQSATRLRDPDTFARFIRMRDEGTIAIDGAAVAKLYGDAIPHGDDKLLGWAPELQAQLESAKATGGDIEVPLADWLAKVDPEVAKQLHDDIRVRPGGITKNEAKVESEQRAEAEVPREVIPDHLPQLRAASGLEPLFSIGDRKLKIEKRPVEMHGDAFGADQWRMLDENGTKVGHLEITAHGGKDTGQSLYVDNVLGLNGHDVQSFGPALMRDLLRQVKEAYPHATEIGGFRISGAREKAGKEKEVWIKLDNPDMAAVRQLFNDAQYKPISPDLEAVYKPIELLTEREHDLSQAIGDELARLIPKQAKVSTPSALRRTKDQRESYGAHISYTDRTPFVIVSLDSPHPIGTAQHEAIHHLRQQGFFTEGEWDTLARAARDGGWIDKFGIDRKYEGLGTAAKLEEAVAEGFRDWKEGNPTPPAAITLFERLQELFTRIKDRLKEIFGREVGWEELFQKVDRGEVGGREGNAPRNEAAFREAASDESAAPKAANDIDVKGLERAPNYQAAAKAQTIERYVNKDTKRGDFKYWRDMAAKEQVQIEGTEMGNANAFIAARAHSEGGKTTLLINPDGNRTIFHDGVKVVRESLRDLPSTKFEVGDETEPKPLFRTPATIGMTARQAALYARRIREMHDSDVEWAQGRAEAEQRKRLTADWKQDYKNTRSAVEADMSARPDVAADLFFGRGELYGERLGEKPKIDPASLTPEDRAALPKDYLAKKDGEGVELDDIASLIGYPNGRSMIEHLIAYNKAKIEANMSSKAFLNRMIDLETERQMAGRHGDLEENILDAAKDQVTSETQLNLIGEEVLALGIRNKGEASINKAEIKSWIEDKFAESPMNGQSSDKYLKAAGKSGTAAEIALLKGDIDEAYRAKQTQFYAMMFAREARTLEKEQKQFAATAKKLGKRDVKGLDQEYQDVIQALLWDAGLTPRRTMLEIQRSQAISGFTSMDHFVETARGDGWAPEVGEEIIAGRMKPIDQMSVDEFREFKSAIDSLNYIGRQVEKINIAGAKEDFATYRDKVVGNITTLPRRPRDSQERGIAHRMFSIDATLTRMENIMKDLDLGEDMGPLVDATIRPMAEAKHKEYSLQEGLSTQIKALNEGQPKKWKKSLNDTIPNDWFRNPSEGNLFKTSRMDMINIMLNWGNKGNVKKFIHAYGSETPGRNASKESAAKFKAQMDDWLNTHATAEDWKFVQGVWDIYKGYRGEMETVWRNTAGTQPKLIEPVQVVTSHGTFEGGYYPLIRDQYMSPLPKKGTGEELFGPDYPNFSTPQGHLKERTGGAYYVDFQQPLGRIPMRMQQVIHDIAYRDAVMATAKVIRDKEIRGAIINHYGKEYADQLEPWLQKTARGSTIDEANQKGIDSILRQARLNLVGYALPWNYVVTLTPDVGSINPKVLAHYYSDKAGNDALANRLSKEIPHAMYNMDRDFKEAMQRAVSEGKLDDYKTKVARWGYGPVSWASKQFRTATFVEKFNEASAEGRTEADAAAIADTYVRERHGAVALHDLPSVMTTGEKGRLLTMFYGYFNTQYNFARTIPAHMRRGDYMKAVEAAWGSIIVGAFFGATIANQAKQEDSWTKRGLKAIPLQLLGMVPFAREAGTLMIEGIPPRTPMGSVIQSAVGAGGDIMRYIQKKPIDSGVKHIAALAGLLGGVPGTLQAGRTGQFLWDVNQGKQRPRDLMEWARGIMTGEAQLKHQGQR